MRAMLSRFRFCCDMLVVCVRGVTLAEHGEQTRFAENGSTQAAVDEGTARYGLRCYYYGCLRVDWWLVSLFASVIFVVFILCARDETKVARMLCFTRALLGGWYGSSIR